MFSLKHPIDRLFLCFSIFAMLSGFGHTTPWNPFLERLGIVLDVCGTYLYARSYFSEDGFVRRLAVGTAWVLIPFAILVGIERITGRNFYVLLGSVREFAAIRDGSFRAQGPFFHPILAGTAGAVCFPLISILWKSRRRLALFAFLAFVVCPQSDFFGFLVVFGFFVFPPA